MAKYHINKTTGNVGRCEATVKPCPHGDRTEHYDSEADARKAYEKQNSSATMKTVGKAPGVRLQRRAEKYVEPKTLSQVPAKVDDETLKNALAYAVVNKKSIMVTYEDLAGEAGIEGLRDDIYDKDDRRLVGGIKNYLIATPRGVLVKVSYKVDIEAQYDEYWRYHPDIIANYSYHENIESLKNNTGSSGSVYVDSDSVFREVTRYPGGGVSDAPSYDWGSVKSALDAGKRALRELPQPFAIAKIGELKNYSGKLSPSNLSNESNFKNKNPEVRAAVVARKEFPKALHEDALRDSAEVRASLAARDDLDRPTMEALMADEGKDVDSFRYSDAPRDVMLKNPKLPVRLQSKIVKDGTLKDMRSLSRNPGLSEINRARLKAKAEKLGIRL